MADKYLKTGTTGMHEEVEATTTSEGAGDSGKIPGLDGTGKLDNSMLPTGIGDETKLIMASEALSAGDLVNVWDDAGATKVRKADASDPAKAADGFVLSAAAQSENATVYFEGTNNQLSGLTGGTKYFLSASTPGDITDAAPTTSGHIVQFVGKAISATEVSFEPGTPIKRA